MRNIGYTLWYNIEMALPEKESFTRYFEDARFRNGVDGLFQRIENPVDEFSGTNGLSVEKFHQDAPVWTLKWGVGFQRMIQIAAELGDVGKPSLSFLAYAYWDRPLTPREFSKFIVLGYVDDPLLDEFPNLPLELLTRAFHSANNIR